MTLPLGQRRAQARRGARIAEDAIREGLAVRAVADAEHRAKVAALKADDREAENARIRLTADDVRGSALVRDEFGWHVVVRVSAKSVTVETPYSWTDRIALDRVLEVRR